MKTIEILEQKREKILNLAAQHGASNIRIFGSVARCEEREDSAIDFIVDMARDGCLLDRLSFMPDLVAS
ncbi:nucleotidyltransferase family protein [Okeania sp. KiyG1]|uniref:nucleotidyltransferase family protein n=1 Tax=Okeania sp. KiyG1 TaxID=2720165 RepID=UPI0019224F28|nr:hypothetical protein CYANOKiyG1_00530 [Okeania sp. KiyG1]